MQICYGIDDYMTKKREINALLKSANETKCKNLIVLTWDYEAKETSDKVRIHYLPIWKWLISSA